MGLKRIIHLPLLYCVLYRIQNDNKIWSSNWQYCNAARYLVQRIMAPFLNTVHVMGNKFIQNQSKPIYLWCIWTKWLMGTWPLRVINHLNNAICQYVLQDCHTPAALACHSGVGLRTVLGKGGAKLLRISSPRKDIRYLGYLNHEFHFLCVIVEFFSPWKMCHWHQGVQAVSYPLWHLHCGRPSHVNK